MAKAFVSSGDSMQTINTIQWVDSLAEITRHRDRELIEKSLLKTFNEFEGSREFWVYKVIAIEPKKFPWLTGTFVI